VTQGIAERRISVFYRLPRELWIDIFEYDPTYRFYLSSHVLPYLREPKLYRACSPISRNIVYISLDKEYAILTNSLTEPSYRSTIFFHRAEEKKEYLDLFEVLELIASPPRTVRFFQDIIPWSEFCDPQT
jgi:hypothetical protein